MPDMRMRTDESPPRQPDRADERAARRHDEVRNIETAAAEPAAISDTVAPWTDDPAINTHGSER
jgi:hypothetical protein